MTQRSNHRINVGMTFPHPAPAVDYLSAEDQSPLKPPDPPLRCSPALCPARPGSPQNLRPGDLVQPHGPLPAGSESVLLSPGCDLPSLRPTSPQHVCSPTQAATPGTSCSKPASLLPGAAPAHHSDLPQKESTATLYPYWKDDPKAAISVARTITVSASAGDKITASGQEAARASRELRTYSESVERWT